MTMSSKVFNENPAVAPETTAGDAWVHAPNTIVADQIEQNSEYVHSAAEDAANVAKTKGPELTGESTPAVDQLQAGVSHVTASAAAEGERDVESAKAASASYIEQAKNLPSSVITTAQSYLPESLVGGTASSDLSPATRTNVPSLKTEVNSEVDTTMQYAKAAQDTLQSQSERVKGLAQGFAGTGGVQTTEQGQVLDVPAISAPLESGPHAALGTTYPRAPRLRSRQEHPNIWYQIYPSVEWVGHIN